MSLSDTRKKLLHPYRRSGRSVLHRRMAGQNRHLPVAKRVGLDRGPRRSCAGGCGSLSHLQALQGHPLLAMRRLFHRTEDC